MRLLVVVFVVLFIASPACAADVPAAASDAPVEISAKHSLEWDRKAKTYTAREEAVASQGDFRISADLLKAYYLEDKKASDIASLTANGNVVIVSPPYTAYGDNAVYEVASGNATLTGKRLRIETPTEQLTAKESIVFYGKENRLVATGGATAVRGADRLNAQELSAIFAEDAQGRLGLRKITAAGGVVIRTLKETIEGDRGSYDPVGQKAELTGRVRIYQGENWLEGTRAIVDLRTGHSRLFSERGDGRVKGVFYPKSTKN